MQTTLVCRNSLFSFLFRLLVLLLQPQPSPCKGFFAKPPSPRLLIVAFFPVSSASVADWLVGVAFHMPATTLYTGQYDALDAPRVRLSIHVELRANQSVEGQLPNILDNRS